MNYAWNSQETLFPDKKEFRIYKLFTDKLNVTLFIIIKFVPKIIVLRLPIKETF